MSPQHTVGLQMLPLPQQVEIDIAERRGEGIRIGIGMRVPIGKGRLDRVVGGFAGETGGGNGFKKTVCMDLGQR